MSGIGDHQRRARHRREHRLARAIAGKRPQARLDQRIALGLLEFVLELLPGHSQVTTPVEASPDQIQRDQHDRRDADRRDKSHRRRQNELRNGGRITEQCIHGHGLLSPQDDRHHNAYGKKLENRLRELDAALTAEYPSPPLGNRNTRILRLDSLEHDPRRVLQKRRRQSCHRQHEDDRDHQPGRADSNDGQKIDRIRTIANAKSGRIIDQPGRASM